MSNITPPPPSLSNVNNAPKASLTTEQWLEQYTAIPDKIREEASLDINLVVVGDKSPKQAAAELKKLGKDADVVKTIKLNIMSSQDAIRSSYEPKPNILRMLENSNGSTGTTPEHVRSMANDSINAANAILREFERSSAKPKAIAIAVEKPVATVVDQDGRTVTVSKSEARKELFKAFSQTKDKFGYQQVGPVLHSSPPIFSFGKDNGSQMQCQGYRFSFSDATNSNTLFTAKILDDGKIELKDERGNSTKKIVVDGKLDFNLGLDNVRVRLKTGMLTSVMDYFK